MCNSAERKCDAWKQAWNFWTWSAYILKSVDCEQPDKKGVELLTGMSLLYFLRGVYVIRIF